ncbi:MAG: formylglycine-generating enzyme family protein, partial [Planctomycetes bacterium]|nr:formylglycine-generating enzyme family protein [Planctomycetota bacterium]
SGADAIEISHEALIPSWTWLRELVQQNRQFLAWRKHTRAAVRTYCERHDDAILLRGRYLAEAMEFRAARADDLTPEELSFVAASVAAAARRKLLLLVGVAALLALSITASIGFLQAKQRTAEFELLASVVTLRAARETEATLSPPWPEKLAAMDEWLDRDVPRLRDALPKLKIALASLELRARPRIGRDARLEFDAESDRFLFETLRSQDQAMEEFLGSSVPRVKQRRAWAKRLDELSRTRDATRWAAVSAAIRAKHGFDLKPQGGLVPLGANPKTGYFEFYELRSAWDGKSDPASIAIPAHDEEGRIAVKDETGIVFVLLPGGAVTLGAQDTDPKGPNYETGAESDEDVHEVRLAPFFLARHELTQAQYLRLTGERNPSSFAAGEFGTDGPAIGWAHPVENLDWDMARQALEPHGLILPTEAQWEYGCRGGTTTAWYAGSEARDLRGHARLSDSALEGDPLQDQWSAHWPVGAGSPKAFGLFDVHGNVWEWCRDWYGAYGTERPGDGIRGDARGSGDRVSRGGCFSNPASRARSADRYWVAPTFLRFDLGLRAARIITE